MGQHLDLGPTGLSWALYGSITTLAGVHPAWDAARSFLEISMSISNYLLPADPYADWKGSEAPGYVPTARQQPLLDAFAAARASGLRYTADIAQFVSKQLCLTAEVLGRNTTNVDGGDFGHDLFYARSCYEAMRKRQSQIDAAAVMGNLPVDLPLGVLVFNDHKRTTGVVVVDSSNPEHIRLRGTRGKLRLEFTTDAVSIKGAIERAASKGFRKDSFEVFVAGLATSASVDADFVKCAESAPSDCDLFATC